MIQNNIEIKALSKAHLKELGQKDSTLIYHQFLNKEVTDYDEKIFENNENINETIKRAFKELRLYKNQEFAFIEVYNKDTFEDNAIIVKEVVELLQNWKIRYTHKQQFLGEFFELLLNTGFKQEAGQFFTPIPLVRFIINSLPVEKIIQKKIQNGDINFLPYVIDYACGSGHFLTEFMDILQNEIISEIDNSTLNQRQKSKLQHYTAGDFEWAKEFIYGIEKDYRLVKTTKDNCVFDLLITNPPYSISGFKSAINKGNKRFILYTDKIKDSSSEIEILFVERMKQLLKADGWGAIILPISILTNSGLYDDARILLLENFYIKTIIQLSSGAFMATGTNTVIFIVQKREFPITLSQSNYQEKLGYEVMCVDSGKKQSEKNFLGYEFSTRKNKEGLKILSQSLLAEISSILNNWHSGETVQIAEKLEDHIFTAVLTDCFSYDSKKFTNIVNKKNAKSAVNIRLLN